MLHAEAVYNDNAVEYIDKSQPDVSQGMIGQFEALKAKRN